MHPRSRKTSMFCFVKFCSSYIRVTRDGAARAACRRAPGGVAWRVAARERTEFWCLPLSHVTQYSLTDAHTMRVPRVLIC